MRVILQRVRRRSLRRLLLHPLQLLRLSIAIQHPLPFPLVANLKHRSSAQHGQRQTLGVNSRLHELLLPGEIRAPSDNGKGPDDAGNPGYANNLVLLLPRVLQRAIGEAHLGEFLLTESLGAVADETGVVCFRALDFEAAGGVVCSDEAGEGDAGGHEEAFHGEGEVADGLVAAAGSHEGCCAADQAYETT